MSMLNILYH